MMNRNHEWLSRAGFAALAVTVLSVGGAAMAADVDAYGASAPAALTVRATPAELGTPRGAKALALRIRVAAATVCGGDVDPPAIRNGDGFANCRDAAIDRAIRDLHAPLVARALGRGTERLASDAR